MATTSSASSLQLQHSAWSSPGLYFMCENSHWKLTRHTPWTTRTHTYYSTQYLFSRRSSQSALDRELRQVLYMFYEYMERSWGPGGVKVGLLPFVGEIGVVEGWGSRTVHSLSHLCEYWRACILGIVALMYTYFGKPRLLYMHPRIWS